MTRTTKKNYKQDYLEDFIGLTGVTDLTLQDIYGAMILLVRHGVLEQKAKSLWSKYQFMHLYRKMLDCINRINFDKRFKIYNRLFANFRALTVYRDSSL